MEKNRHGHCKELRKENKDDSYVVTIIYKDSSTYEGREYSKSELRCKRNSQYHTCKMHECPIWKDAPDVIDENGIPIQP